jgi:CheY-like chemotaxis protein
LQPFIPDDLIGLNVLVIDDNENASNSAIDILNILSCNVECAVTLNEALEMLDKSIMKNRVFQLILLDNQLKNTDGLTAVKKIRENPRYNEIHIILTSQVFNEDTARKAQAAGVSTFLLKPLFQTNLADRIFSLFIKDHFPANKSVINIEEYQLAGLAVLLVEDNVTNQLVVRETLAKVGISIDIADNGHEAIEAVERKKYDVILMDIQMPDMDGYEAAAIIREKYSFEDMPIIALTAHSMVGDREKCLNAGMNDYLTKPINKSELFSLLNKWKDNFIPKADTILDMTEGIERYNDNSELYFELLNIFILDHANSIEKIEHAVKMKDFEGAFRIAHTLKGVTGNLAARRLFTAADRLTILLKEKKLKLLTPLIEESRVILKDTIEAIKRM